MASSPPPSAGFSDSLRALGDGLLAGARDRLELFTLELQEEKYRLVQMMIWISAIIFTAMMAVAFASLTLVYLFWDAARLAALGGLTVLYSGSLALIVIAFRRYLARQRRPFAATLEEIEGDRACIRKRS